MYDRLVPVDHGSPGGSSGQRVRARRWRNSAMSASGTCSVNGFGVDVLIRVLLVRASIGEPHIARSVRSARRRTSQRLAGDNPQADADALAHASR